MFKIVGQKDENIIVEALGKIEQSDYKVLADAVDEVAQKHGKANLMMVVPKNVSEDLKTAKKDFDFGMTTYKKVAKMAVVTDEAWLKGAVEMMSPFTATKEKTFSLNQKSQAKNWLIS